MAATSATPEHLPHHAVYSDPRGVFTASATPEQLAAIRPTQVKRRARGHHPAECRLRLKGQPCALCESSAAAFVARGGHAASSTVWDDPSSARLVAGSKRRAVPTRESSDYVRGIVSAFPIPRLIDGVSTLRVGAAAHLVAEVLQCKGDDLPRNEGMAMPAVSIRCCALMRDDDLSSGVSLDSSDGSAIVLLAALAGLRACDGDLPCPVALDRCSFSLTHSSSSSMSSLTSFMRGPERCHLPVPEPLRSVFSPSTLEGLRAYDEDLPCPVALNVCPAGTGPWTVNLSVQPMLGHVCKESFSLIRSQG